MPLPEQDIQRSIAHAKDRQYAYEKISQLMGHIKYCLKSNQLSYSNFKDIGISSDANAAHTRWMQARVQLMVDSMIYHYFRSTARIYIHR
jgi:hypothetical protein